MDPISGIAGAGLSLIGTIAGQVAAANDRASAAAAMQRASEAYNIPLPVLQQMVAEQLGPSAQESVYADPNLQAAQSDSLGGLQRISDSGGMTTEDRVNDEMMQRDAAQRAMAQRKSIVNTLARSGVNPGGASVAMQLGAARDQQEAGALAGAQTAADARRRAMQAVLQRGQMAGQMRSQGFNEASSRASATDKVREYNNRVVNQARMYNLGLPQQNFQNQMNRAAGMAGAQRSYADSLTGRANQTASMWSDLGAGAGKAVGGALGGGGAAAAPAPSTTYGDDPISAPMSLDPNDPYSRR
jgi:hypothetical protein